MALTRISGPERASQAKSHRIERALGRHVGNAGANAHHGSNRRNVDDACTRAPFHERRQRPDHLECPYHVDRVDVVKVLGRQAFKIAGGDKFRGAGVIHQRVASSPFIFHAARQRAALFVVRHVGLDHQHVGAKRTAFIGHRVRRARVPRKIDHDVIAITGKQPGRCSADS